VKLGHLNSRVKEVNAPCMAAYPAFGAEAEARAAFLEILIDVAFAVIINNSTPLSVLEIFREDVQ
jgi:hypothetical protein